MIRKKGLTLIEVVITAVMFAMLAGVIAYAFRVVYLTWAAGQARCEMDISLDGAVEEMAREIREADGVQSTAGYNEIRFERDGAAYIYYLYNGGDSYGPPPAFNEDSYELRRCDLPGGIAGSFTYGEGKIMTFDVLPPPATDLSLAGNMVTIDITASRNAETIRTRTEVRPRGL
ncbi:MAG: prepilin-type N-terminal cleavage/methylation domain-containing protein [Candidatus Omnitrophica bacterium]|nr:prepilin-type N-terminal cleavage/methylation domain-containing protein [Candidatus Omnitrophota bacterium]MBU1784276.1 prepilin-type N-terminal cleavage/methylation domain-containing protein [Candidatus Omnitrophota bacterium]